MGPAMFRFRAPRWSIYSGEEQNPQTELAYLQLKIYKETYSVFLDPGLKPHLIRLIWQVIRYMRVGICRTECRVLPFNLRGKDPEYDNPVVKR